MLFTQSVTPPQSGIPDDKRKGNLIVSFVEGNGCACHYSAGSGISHRKGGFVYFLVRLNFYFSHDGCTVFTDFLLTDEDIAESGVVPCFNVYRTPNAGGH